MTFQTYAQAGFTAELLPILPPDAKINPASPQAANLEKSRGKVPGRKTREGWYGLADWTSRTTTTEETERWAGWGAGIGMQGRLFPAVDIDIEEEELADAIEAEALIALGAAPARFGRGARRLLVYRGAGFAKRRLAFRLGRGSDGPPGGHGVRGEGLHHRRGDDLLDEGCERETAEPDAGSDGADGIVHAVEFLGQGQQYVVEGIHPRTGQPYAWRAGRSPATMGGPDALCPIEPEEVDAFYERITWMIEELYDGEIVGYGAGAGQGSGQGAGVWQEGLLAPSLDAIEQVLGAIENDVDYDEWLSIMAAVKGAAGEGLVGLAKELFLDWSARNGKDDPEITESKWESLRPPFRVGWDSLARRASDRTGGAFNAAAYDFAPVAAFAARPGDEGDDAGRDAGDGADDLGYGEDPVEAMFRDYAWIERQKRAYHYPTGALLDQEQFEFRIPPAGKTPAWKKFKDQPGRRRSFLNTTFRPGQGLEVREDMPGLSGMCLNTWRDPHANSPLPPPGSVSDADVAPWLELVSVVVPNEAERRHVLGFLAWTAQRPSDKIHHALVLGSKNEGVGKDTLLEPLRIAIGKDYTREISPETIAGSFNDFLVGAKLIVVQEMHNFERRETMNRLKPLIAAPPEALPVNEKFKGTFYIPNIASLVFFTNEPDALSPGKGDRRYFICWNDNDPMPAEDFDRIWTWLRAGGAQKAARWLLDYDLAAAGFNAKGRAPDTEAKEMMRRESRNSLQEWIEDGIAEGDFPFDRDLILAEDVQAAVPDWAKYKGARPSAHKVGKALERAGAVKVSDKMRIQNVPGSRRIWAVRRTKMYDNLLIEQVRDLFLDQRAKAEAAANLEGGREFR